MKTKGLVLAISMLFVAACVGGTDKVIGSYNPTEQSFTGVVIQSGSGHKCPPLPGTFRESDLAGTWEIFTGESGEMTLTLKADGTYKQVYDYSRTNGHYETDWQHWYLERHDHSTSYVHFQGMLSCSGTCTSGLGGTWYDFCEQQMITVRADEKILMLVPVTSTLPINSPLAALHGIEMYEPVLDPDSNPVVYRLKH